MNLFLDMPIYKKFVCLKSVYLQYFFEDMLIYKKIVLDLFIYNKFVCFRSLFFPKNYLL